MTFQEPWYLHAISVAQRVHRNRVTASGAPYWTMCDTVAGNLVRRRPDAPRHLAEACVLYGALDNGRTLPVHLRALGIGPDVLGILVALQRDPTGDYVGWVESLVQDPHGADAVEVELAWVFERIVQAARDQVPPSQDDLTAFGQLAVVLIGAGR